MGQSNSRRRYRFIVSLDRAAIGGLALGLTMYVMPFWREGRLLVAFWVTLVSTVLHVYTSHERSRIDSPPLSMTSRMGQTESES